MRNLSNYSGQFENGNIMPLLMNFTPSTKIQEETNPAQFIYNDGKQVVIYNMGRQLGTYSLKIETTKRGQGVCTDRKNAIDDSKFVK